MIDKNIQLDEIFPLAVAELEKLQTGEQFIVKELFRGYEWNRTPKGLRTKLGSLFFAYAKGTGSTNIKPLGKTPQNQQIYVKL